MRARTGSGLVAALVLASVLGAQDVGAGDENSWPRFPGSAYASQSDPADRTFIKEWEATPPKGYPTLSPSKPAGHEGGHQALHGDRGGGRMETIARRPAAARHVASGGRRVARASADVGRSARTGRQHQLRFLCRQGREALPGFKRLGSHRHRRQADARCAQHSGRIAPQAAQGQSGRGSPNTPRLPASAM